jgi:hypothetical protein
MHKKLKAKPYKDLAEALTAHPTPAEFQKALVDDLHFEQERFKNISADELFHACDVDGDNMERFRIFTRPSSRRLFQTSDTGWWFICTYSIKGRNRRRVRFETHIGDRGVIDYYEDPYAYRRRSNKHN